MGATRTESPKNECWAVECEKCGKTTWKVSVFWGLIESDLAPGRPQKSQKRACFTSTSAHRLVYFRPRLIELSYRAVASTLKRQVQSQSIHALRTRAMDAVLF